MRMAASSVLPSAKVIGQRLLNEAAETVEKKMDKILKGKSVGLKWVLLDILKFYTNDEYYFEAQMGGNLLWKVQPMVFA